MNGQVDRWSPGCTKDVRMYNLLGRLKSEQLPRAGGSGEGPGSGHFPLSAL